MIAERDGDRTGGCAGFDLDEAAVVRALLHGLHGVEQDVDEDLLEFDMDDLDVRHVWGEGGADFSLSGEQFAVKKLKDLAEQIVYAAPFAVEGLFVEHGAEVVDHRSGAFVVTDDVFERGLDFPEVEVVRAEVSAGRLGVAQDGGERLVEFVGEGRCDFTEGCNPAAVSDLLLELGGRRIRAGVLAGLTTWVLAFLLGTIGPWLLTSPGSVTWEVAATQSAIALLSGIMTATIVGGILPMIESLFGITTDISWLEAADLNHPLLTQMALKAPGTYYHSMAVAQLAEAAAQAVGANETVCRVGAYFHDIGKLVKPAYFTENCLHDKNPHDDLTPTMSALIIKAHVKEGVDLALKHHLNRTIIDVIQQHHGTSLVSYFYRRSLQQQEDARRGMKIMNLREDDIPDVKEESFRYGGPKPQSRESAIISLADSVESASRSLRKPTPQRIEQLIDDILADRIQDRQLDDSHLTLNEIRQIGETFAVTLRNMMHQRIAYERETHGTREDIATGQPPVVLSNDTSLPGAGAASA